MSERFSHALAAAFPDRPVEAVTSTGPSWNELNQTARVDFADGGRIYLKVAVDGDGSRLVRERAVLAFLESSDEVTVPHVAAAADGDVPYLATEPVSGDSLLDRWSAASDENRELLARRVGAALARIHAHRFDDHGVITGGGGDGLKRRRESWSAVVVETIREMRAIASTDRFDRYFDAVIDAVGRNRDVLDDAPRALLHGDPARPNCFVDGETVGFLDWEIAHVGDPARELLRARSQQLASLRQPAPERLVAALYEGYREQAGRLPAGLDERRPVYDAVRFLGQLGAYDKWAAYLDEPPAELATWMDAEMKRRLAAIS